ncbi:MAG TPA: RNA polymerase sigma factor [Phycisphaerae bacterium]|nr:RNA polymerase sigma factor [Phycisphaerae bacterium]HOJ76250.1 RNA polymerase sigma factor [Phycisphaerae bacterium]HOM53642.1 RNA polymerase sigma factor [Phycisphaerae bacterium]HPP28993.1 RNA polymerase sigma factor [Phycisphaerae bacterium]HPU28345.1 RNA polymerase sigma factor [Phycisphaerae bacterium]
MGSTPTALPLELRSLLAGLSSATVADDQQWILHLLRQHGAAVVSMLWRLLGSEQEVLDAYQTAVCRLTAGGKEAARTNPGGYFYRIAMNAGISTLRHRKQHRQHEPMLADYQARRAADRAASAGSVYDQQAALDRLREAIFHLPMYMRAVIVLRDLAELPYTRVASILGIGVGTARLYRCQAVARLADLLGQETAHE